MSARTLTSAVNTELGQSTTAPRWLVKIEFDGGDVRLWNGLGNLTFDGEVYTGAGRLARIEPISETQDIVASGVQMSLHIMPTTDQPDAVDAILNLALAEEYQGRSVTIWQAQMAEWSPARLFDASEAGVWYDPSDSSTVWQDSARTTPAVADDPVGAIDDKSGNGNHALQTTSDRRPILRQTGVHWYLESDGTDDSLLVEFGLTQPMERISAFRLISEPVDGYLFGSGSANRGIVHFTDDTSLLMYSGSTISTTTVLGTDYVLTERHHGATSRVTVNNETYVTGDAGTGESDGIVLHARNATQSRSNTRIYGVVMGSFSTLSDVDIQRARNYMAVKAGVTELSGSLDMLLLDVPFIRFKGKLDVMRDSELPGSAVITITAENRMIDLERPRLRTWTPEDQNIKFPDDTFFDEVAALQNREIEVNQLR